ncbi:flagellar biosynthetic protein FliR [Pleionea sediminis]|uniref:flagellar biosynthetic protein FliR n=1 Tax=Pleionea sediminis TaxID=2569479 RepID=UPI001184AF77|nr:flagellar biosynthetic protein FliR [Pleionea sediminis]
MLLETLSIRVLDGLLVMIRFAPLFFSSSMTPMARMPQLAKVSMMVSFSILIVTILPAENDWFNVSLLEFLLVAANELFIGVMLLFGFIAAQSAIMTMGRMIEMQIGFGAAGIINPSTSQSESVIGTLLTMVSVFLMFLLMVDHSLITSLFTSFIVTPVGNLLYPDALSVMVPNLAAQFILALLLVLPVSLGLLCLDLVIGYLAKTMPQMNIYFVSLPLKIGVGLVVFSLVAPTMINVFKRIFGTLNDYWLNFVGV